MELMNRIKENYIELLREGNLFENVKRISQNTENRDYYYENLTESEIPSAYFWRDINYGCTNRAGWDCSNHYARILVILTENSTERLKTDAIFRNKMTGALKFWLYKDFYNSNWWHNDIGTPSNIGDITLLLSDFLDSETLSKATEIVARGSMATRSDISEKWTGTNLLWGGVNTIKHALLTKDTELLLKAIERISEEIKIDNEGIQPDGSFFQHGRRLYSGGYGRAFAYDISKLSYYLQGTKYQFSPEKLNLFLTHVLDGIRYMTKGDALDMAALNREIVRENAIKTGIVKKALELMIRNQDMPRRDELKTYLDSINGKETSVATKLFSDAMLLCHHADGIYVGAKFTTDKMWDQDTCNGEGELCLNMTYGTHTNIMKDGTEYLNITPLWDYSKIPGTTARIESEEVLQKKFDLHNWCCDPLPNDHYGCKQKGNNALIFEKAEHDGIISFVTDFSFSGGFVSLGAGISDAKGEELFTTIDQCHLNGEVIREGRSIIHHGIRYTELEDTNAECTVINAVGDWKRVDKFRASKKVKGELLLITVNHKPQNSGKYAYMISSAAKNLPQVKIIENTEKVQAILTPENKIMAVFHEKTAFVYGGKEYKGENKTIIIE